MTGRNGPRVGQIVMYVEDDSRYGDPAIITSVIDSKTVDLVLFQTHAIGEPAQARHRIPHAPPGDTTHPHSWHELDQT